MPIVIMELQKKLNELFFGKTVYEYKNENRSYQAFDKIEHFDFK